MAVHEAMNDRSSDETERLREMAELRGSGDLLQAVLEAAEGIIFAKDLDGRYVLANPAFSRLVNLPLKEIIGKRDEELFPKEEAARLRAGDATVVETERPLSSADRLTIGGKERVFVSTKVPLRDKSGRIIGISGFATEITDEIRIRDQLAHLNQTLRAIRAVNQLITQEKDRARLLQGTCELLIETRGYHSAWIALLDGNKGLTAFFHAGLGDEAASLEKMLKNGELPECVRRALERSGVVMIGNPASECNDCPLLGKASEQRELTARLEYGGKVYGVVSMSVPREYAAIREEQELLRGLARDVSFALHAIEADEARRESEELYRSIVENSHAGILVIDEAYRFIYVNDELCRILGRGCEEILGHDFREFLDEESRDLATERYRRRQRGEKVPSRYEFNVVRKDGEKRRVGISSTVIRDSTGRVRTIAQLLDITDLMHAEEKLKESEAKYRSLIEDVLDSSSVGVFILDSDFKVVWINRALERYFGLRREEVLGRDKRELIRTRIKDIFEDPDGFAEKVLSSYEDNTYVQHFECHVLPGPGREERWLNHWSQPIRSGRYAGGRVEHYTDITVRKRLEASLQESEEQFRFVAESAADAIIIGDGEGKVVFWNKAAQEIFGYTAEEIVGRSIALLMPERFRKNFLKRMEQQRKTGEVPGIRGRMIQTGLRKDGSEFPAEISYAAWKGGDEMFSTAIIRDITERMAAEKALKDSYEKLERTLEGIVEALGAAIELRDPYTAGHQRRVAELAVAIAEEMGLPTEKVEATRYAALVHDIGKLAVPAEILAKPAALTDTEFALIKFHPQQAYDILKEIDFPWPLAEIVLQHHERLDGSGYPSGLKGDEILLEARIIAVADVVEAMSSHRPYRPALGIEAACDEIKAKRGRLYDPDVVDACVSLFEKGFSFA